MTTKEKVDKILESLRGDLTEFVEQAPQISTSIEYEERLVALTKQLAVGIISQDQGKMPKSRNSKKSVDQFRSS